jgi:hypothetical protein
MDGGDPKNVLDFNSAGRQFRSIDADDIRERLNQRVATFVNWLFSGRALITKSEARIGNTAGEPGASLAIALTGPKVGQWYDHSTKESGDLIELYRLYMGYTSRGDFQLSLKELAKEFLGDNVEIARAPWQHTATARIEEKKVKLGTKPRSDHTQLGAPVETFKYYDLRGNIIASVARYQPDGTRENKTFRPYCYRNIGGKLDWGPGAPDLRPLFQLPEFATATNVVLTEGEGPARRLLEVGIISTSAMQGCNTPIEKVDWSPLVGKTVIVWPDADAVGLDYGDRIAGHLTAIGCSVLVIAPPEGVPAGWDAADCITEGRDPHKIIETAQPYVKIAKPLLPIPVLSIADLRALPARKYIIDGWIFEDSLGFVYGDPGCGKSFLILDWLLHLAYKMPTWHGVPIKSPGPILYILQEDERGLINRIDAFKRHYGLVDDPEDFDIITLPLSFLNEACVDAVVQTVQALNKDYRLIPVDTVSRVLPGADENLQKEMTLFITACERIRAVFRSTVIGVHHTSKSGDMRGSTVFRGAGEFVYKLEKEKGVKPIKVTCEKLKNEEDGWERIVNLEKVVISDQGPLDFNRPKTSLVVTGISGAGAEDETPTESVQKDILEAIDRAWKKGQPWSDAPQSRSQNRYAATNITRQFFIHQGVAEKLIHTWIEAGILEKEVIDSRNKKYGLKVAKNAADNLRNLAEASS